tara:strand:- start:190 stop:1596 length:1407 start_codon:yes stop_codon:yes gene_type:complete
MSLDILKERFNVKKSVSESEKELQYRQQYNKLENNNVDLQRKLSLMEDYNETLLSELNKFKQNEESTILLKEEEFNNKLHNKDLDITNLKLDLNSLYEQIDIKDEKINYKNKMINESLYTLREAKSKIDNLENKLKLTENKNLKEIKNLKLQIEENYDSYMYNLKSLENDIVYNNKIIKEKKEELKNSLKEITILTENFNNLQKKNKKDEKTIKELNKKVENGNKSLISENNTFKKELSEKNKYINKLKDKVGDLTDKIRITDNLKYKNKEFEKNNPNVQSLIELLKNVSKEKHKMRVMDWNQWKEIPENQYLIELSMKAAKEAFNDNNSMASRGRNSSAGGGLIPVKFHIKTDAYGTGYTDTKGLIWTIKEEDGQTEKTIINETVARAGSITKDVIINPSKKYTWSIVKESAGAGNPKFKNLTISGKGVLPVMENNDEPTGTFEKINSDVNLVGTVHNVGGGGGGGG